MTSPIKYIAALFFLYSCSNSATESKKEPSKQLTIDSTIVQLTEAQIKNSGIETGLPDTTAINGILTLQGTIDVPPQSMVSVSSPLGGYLKKTELLPGLHVRKGETIAVLEDMQFIQLQQDYLATKEKLKLANLEYERQQQLNASKASSDKLLQQSSTEVQTLLIASKALEQKLELLGINPVTLTAANISKSVNIRSAIDGFVSKVNVNIGKYTSPTDVMFELVNPKDIHLQLDVFEKDILYLSIGQKVWAYTNANPQKKYEAEIILISKNLNEDRMTQVHCHFEQYDAQLLPGMYMNAEVVVARQGGLVVPEDAVVRWQNQFYIFTAKDNSHFEMRKVEPGIAGNGRQQIAAEGIVPTTRLVTKNAYALLMQLKNTAEEE